MLTVKRDTETLEISLNPVKSSQDGSYKRRLVGKGQYGRYWYSHFFIILKTDYSEDWDMVFVMLTQIV